MYFRRTSFDAEYERDDAMGGRIRVPMRLPRAPVPFLTGAPGALVGLAALVPGGGYSAYRR